MKRIYLWFIALTVCLLGQAQKVEKVRVTNLYGSTLTYDLVSVQKKGIYVWDEQNNQVFIPNKEMKSAVCLQDGQEVVIWSDSLNEVRMQEKQTEKMARRQARADRLASYNKNDDIQLPGYDVGKPKRLEEPVKDKSAEEFQVDFEFAENTVWYGERQCLGLNSETRHLLVNGRVYDFGDILNYSLEDDASIVTEGAMMTTKPKNVVGRAIVGGMIGGDVGAVVGGTTAKRETKVDPARSYTVHDYTVFVTVNDLKNPVETLYIGESTADMHNVCSLLDVIIMANDETVEDENVNETVDMQLDLAPETLEKDTVVEWKGHLSFKGIPLDGPLKAFVRELEKKGMVNIAYEDGSAVLKGEFAGYKDCFVGVYTVPGEDVVSKAVVAINQFLDWSSLKRNYDDLLTALTSKYGEPWESIFKSNGLDEWLALLSDDCTFETVYVTESGKVTIMLKYVPAFGRCIILGYQDGINGEREYNAVLEDL